RISPAGIVSTFAGRLGTDGFTDGSISLAEFGKPAELVLDGSGNLYVVDALNHTIRKISKKGLVSTIGGSVGQFGSDDGINGAGRFFNPYGIAFSPTGRLVVADTYNQTIRELVAPFETSLSANGNETTVAWESVIGENYTVQFRNGLGEG